MKILQLIFFSENECAGSREKLMNKQHGFTLVELMITLVIAAIMVSIAIPSFNGMINRNQTMSTANDLLADIQLARSEAIKQDKLITLCPSSDASTCSGSWTDGWIVYRPEDNVVLAVRTKTSNNIVVTGAGAIAAGVSYYGTGRGDKNGSFSVKQGDIEYNVDINLSGRPRVIPPSH